MNASKSVVDVQGDIVDRLGKEIEGETAADAVVGLKGFKEPVHIGY
jgi:hypothetical protein